MPASRIQPHSVLIVSAVEKAGERLSAVLPPARFSPVRTLKSAGEARRLLPDTPADIVIINTPLTDEFGTELAETLAEDAGRGVLVLVRAELFDATADRLEHAGVMTLSKPCAPREVYQAARLMSAALERLSALYRRNRTLESKVEEIRLVNRAKWLLIAHLSMDEAAAHRLIERQAMDTRQTLGAVAQRIILTYEN